MYIFIAIIFIAELIIAHWLISNIVKLGKQVQYYNACVKTFNQLLQTCIQYVRCLVSSFKNSSEKAITYIKKKREQFIYKIIMVIAIYSLLILFKVKTNKAKKIVRLVGAIKDLALELAI